MSIQIKTLVLGPMQNNTVLLIDNETKEIIVIDPSFNSEQVQKEIHKNGYILKAIWLTHAHFDHFTGISLLLDTNQTDVEITIHKDDLAIYLEGGEAKNLGIDMPTMPEPTSFFEDAQIISFSNETIEIRHAPGHSPGHVIFYLPEQNTAICGDVIFHQGIGRTDLTGGDYYLLIKTIKEKVFSLPSDTRIISGHGASTSVGEEMEFNPFLQ